MVLETDWNGIGMGLESKVPFRCVTSPSMISHSFSVFVMDVATPSSFGLLNRIVPLSPRGWALFIRTIRI